MATPSFNRDGTYDLTTIAKRLAAAEAMLANIALVPTVYGHEGPAWCREEMYRLAAEGARQLAGATRCPYIDGEGYRCVLSRGHRAEVAHNTKAVQL